MVGTIVDGDTHAPVSGAKITGFARMLLTRAGSGTTTKAALKWSISPP